MTCFTRGLALAAHRALGGRAGAEQDPCPCLVVGQKEGGMPEFHKVSQLITPCPTLPGCIGPAPLHVFLLALQEDGGIPNEIHPSAWWQL